MRSRSELRWRELLDGRPTFLSSSTKVLSKRGDGRTKTGVSGDQRRLWEDEFWNVTGDKVSLISCWRRTQEGVERQGYNERESETSRDDRRNDKESDVRVKRKPQNQERQSLQRKNHSEGFLFNKF